VPVVQQGIACDAQEDSRDENPLGEACGQHWRDCRSAGP
jgi:hypothetical protein